MKLDQFADLSKRLVMAIGIVLVSVLLIVFSANPVVSVIVVGSVVAMAAVGVWEYARLARTKGVKPAVALMGIVAACVVLAFFIAHKWIHSQELPVFVFAIGVGLFFLNRFRRSEEALLNVAVDFFGVAYVAVPLSYMLAILYPIGPNPVIDGRWWLFYLIAVTKITDVGAYFIGRLWGKAALAPVLSPKKTVEGAVGGLLCTIGASLVMAYVGKVFASGGFSLSYIDALWLGLLIGVFGQLGDLAESLLKRDAEVKDSNKIPGLGGILDMIDSLIFTAPIVYFYLRWVS
jgi:phosphatidate cytidylyltransferase